jgi:hypothetical protein
MGEHMKKEYLGNSVYASFDGYHIVLTTENGYPDDPRNQIALEPSVLRNLNDYNKRIYEFYKEKQR